MTSNQLMTAGAIAFAAFAVWTVTKKQGGGALSSQPGQQARDAGLEQWHAQVAGQYNELARQQSQESFRETEKLYTP